MTPAERRRELERLRERWQEAVRECRKLALGTPERTEADFLADHYWAEYARILTDIHRA